MNYLALVLMAAYLVISFQNCKPSIGQSGEITALPATMSRGPQSPPAGTVIIRRLADLNTASNAPRSCKLEANSEIRCLGSDKNRPPLDGSLDTGALGYTAQWLGGEVPVPGAVFVPDLTMAACELLCAQSYPTVGTQRWCNYIDAGYGTGVCTLYTDYTCAEPAVYPNRETVSAGYCQ